MLLTIKDIPFSGLAFKHWHTDDKEIGVVVVSGMFHINENSHMRFSNEQSELLLEDVFIGETNKSSLLQDQEIAPAKLSTDITLKAVARSPEAKVLSEWPVRLNIQNRLSYGFHICGERFFEKGMDKKFRLSGAKKITQLPIEYEYAYGGVIKEDENTEHIHHENPVGRGLFPEFLKSTNDPILAPQIGDAGDFSSGSIDEPWLVCGFGAIAKFWLPRRMHAGTFDQSWQHERYPRMPKDYSLRFWNSAPNVMQIKPYLRGNEFFELKGVRHQLEPYCFQLPRYGLAMKKIFDDGSQSDFSWMNLDLVYLDVSHENQHHHRAKLNWRLLIREPENVREIIVDSFPLEQE